MLNGRNIENKRVPVRSLGEAEPHDSTPAGQAGKPEIAAGGARFAAIDGTNERDRALVRTAIKRWPKRWRGLGDEQKEGFVSDLVAARQKAREVMDNSHDPEAIIGAVEAINSCARTAVLMEGQVQADEHLEEKNSRLDNGQETESVGVRIIPPPTIRRIGDQPNRGVE